MVKDECGHDLPKHGFEFFVCNQHCLLAWGSLHIEPGETSRPRCTSRTASTRYANFLNGILADDTRLVGSRLSGPLERN